ncbi:MAG: hypothetical protein FWB80_07640 [Defluviitaleaceae bacterium]|nr:hypothetical protein [Defluviitaleaceae bacterium]
MLWLISGITLFVVTMLGFITFLGLWTYHDARVKSQHPPIVWALLVVLVPNMMGFIVYLLVGRPNKDVPAPGKFKRLAIASAVCFALGTVAFVGGLVHVTRMESFDAYGARQVGSFSHLEDTLRNGAWEITAAHANGHSRRTPVLTAEEMDNFRVRAEGTGQMTLIIEQDGRAVAVDITDDIRRLTWGDFTPGRFIFTIEFEESENVDIAISWR